MMLKKKVCLKCCKPYWKYISEEYKNEEHIPFAFEMEWRLGAVVCVNLRRFQSIPIKGSPPDNCPYILEHSV